MRSRQFAVVASLFFMSTLVASSALAASSAVISVVPQAPLAVSLLSIQNAATYTINYTVHNNNPITNKTSLKMQPVNLGAIPTNVLSAAVQKNTCVGDLKSGDQCTFQVLLKVKPALKQTQSVLLKPVVCASGGVCATPILGNTVWLLHSTGVPQSIRVMPQPPLSTRDLLVDDKIQYVAIEQFSKGVFPVTTLVRWSSSNPKVLSVDQHGVVRALKPGSASITARDMQANLQGSATVYSKLVIGSVYKGGIAFQVPFSGDTGGGLIAKRDAAMDVPWEKAKSVCQKPWRLPTMAELGKIKANAPLLIAAKANLNTGKSHYYWSSAQSDAQHVGVLSLSPLNLDAQPVRSKTDPAYVRCVRTF
jgi:hypothetical protein